MAETMQTPGAAAAPGKVYISYPEGKMKALTMSYDDGTPHDKRLVEIFNRYGIKGTFNLNYGMHNDPWRLPLSEMEHLYDGHEIATHGYTHPHIASLPLTEVVREIAEDRKGWESFTGGLVRGHAYPYGAYNEEIKSILRSLGIAYARTVGSTGWYGLPRDPLEWHPTCHHDNPRLMEFAKHLVEAQEKEDKILLYVWGHSYEFEDHGNWDRIEEFCAYVGGKEDIWYATNIEIIDYLEAADRLRFSEDCTRVFNPSAQGVWLRTEDGRVICARGGEMTHLA